MNSLDDGLEGLRLDEQIFENVKFYVSGTVPEKVIELLKNGGAQRMIYFADYVTHLICGEDASETDLSDATDLYEVPAVVPKWVLMCVRLKKLVSVKPYVFAPTKLFTNLVFCFSKLDGDLNALWAIITYNGGLVQLTLDKGCTHLVTTSTLSPKYLKAFSMGAANIKIVTPDWVVESVKNKSLLDVDLYHPRLIQWPKVVKHESTTAITGFEPEQSELDPKPLETNATTDSTQALLDKLKQRMPWNQPQVATSATVTTVTEAPPNVVAPTYTGPKLVHDQQQRVLQQQPQPQPGALPASFTSQPSPNVAITTSQQIVRTVVHHTAQPRHFLPLQQQQQQNFNQQRFIQQRPLQQTTMRGQLPNQYPQQLLQQRPQQIGQPPVVTQLPQMAQQIQNQPPLNKPGLHQQVLLNRQMAQTQGQSFMQQLNQQKGVGGFQQLQQQNQQQFNPGPMQGQVLNQPQSDHFGGGSRQGFGQHINQHVQGGQQVQGQHGMQLQNQLQNQQLSGQQMQGGQLSGQQMQGGPLPGQQMQGGQLSGQQMQGGQLSGQQMQGGQPMQTQQIQGQPQLQGQQQMQNQLQNQQNHVPNQQIQGQLQNQLQNLQGQQIQNAQREQALQNQQMQQVQGIQNQQLQQNIQQNIQQQQQQQQQAQSQQVQSQQQSQQGQSPLPNQQMQGQLQNQQQMQGQVQNQQMPNQQQQQQMQNQQNQQLIPNQQLHGQQFRNQLQGQQNQQLQGQQLQGQPQLQNQQMQPQQLMQGQLLQTQQLHPQQIAQPQLVQGQQQLQQLPPPPQNQQIFQQNPPQVLNQQLFTQPNQQNQPRQVNQHLWQQQQLGMRHPGGIVQQVQQPQGARIQWSPGQQAGLPQRQFIQLDAQTHQQLQQMAPEQRALFVAKIQQKQRQIFLQKQQLQQLQQQRGGHILIRGSVPPGLNQQQQMQWLQQQAKQQGIVLQSNLGQQPSVQLQQQQQQQQPPPPPPQGGLGQNAQHAPGLSPIQPNQQFGEQQQQQTQQQLLQRQFHLQQLQLQREQAQKTQQGLVQQPQQPQPAVLQQPQQQPVVRPLVATPAVDAVLPPAPTPTPGIDGANIPPQHPLVVNAKTKTALANMLSIRLQSGGSTIGPAPENMAAEPSAAGTLRLMTAQHNAALNSSARPQDLLGLQQRRAINGPNGELIRPVTPAVVPTPQAAEPPKLQYSPRAAAPIQHRPGPFYGHNPNLKLPPDLFLLGCVFVVVELERYLEESFPGWQQKIEKHGGEIERQYCSRVTHVLCETQRHGVVMQALRDYKRCVTLYWLSDVIKRKQVLPPWTALHLPTMYLDTTPASKHLISLSGFTGSERNRVKHMIKYTGATVTTYFTKHNTLLIASKPEGPKYLHAKKWGTPVVNVQWLTDVMLGNFTALNQMEHIKYQQFSNPPNFSFDPVLVPNLMHAWKMPINISQESYERVKRSASPVTVPKKPKKLKTEHATDENDNVDSRALQTSSHRVLFSMCSGVEDLKNIVKQLGGALALSHVDCTHLIMPQLARTNKLLHCICRGVHILPESWLRDSLTANKFLDESNYSLDTKDFNSEYRCDFTQTLATKNRNKLFEGKYFFVTPSVYPSKKMVVELIESCAGVVEKVRRTSAEIEATNMNSPYSYIILTQENDLHLVSDLLRNKKDKVRIVCNVELIFSAILKQTFEVEPYAVKVL